MGSKTIEALDPREAIAELPEIGLSPFHSKLNKTLLNRAVKEVVEAERVRDRDRIVLEHLPLVKMIALRVHENLPISISIDDIVHAGIMGLFEAVTKFDPRKEVAFSTYATQRIKQSILDYLRQSDDRKPGRSPAIELAVDDKVGEKRGSEKLEKQELRVVLSAAMKTLPERYQKVLVLYYSNEMTMDEIARVLGISLDRASKIHRASLEKMALALAKLGIRGEVSEAG